MVYYIADPHFGHSNIIHLCQRPFDDVEEMNETMIRNWNSRVQPDDTVYVLGDLFFRCEEEQVVDILKQLQGRKHLVKGNHDESWMSKVNLEDYFESVEFMTEANDDDRICVLCHYPLLSWRREKKSYMIYGHIHDNTNADFWPLIAQRDLMLNAGVEVNQYMPVTLEELIANNEVFKADHAAPQSSIHTIKVAAAILLQDGNVFATQRGSGDYKDYWEFPGGKIEPGETPEEALVREIREELDTEIEVGEKFATVEYDYPKFHLLMECFLCSVKSGELKLKVHEGAAWLTAETLDTVEWLPADLELIAKIRVYLERQ